MSIFSTDCSIPACFIVGHRPNRFHFQENDPGCKRLKSVIETEIKRLYEVNGIRRVWVGGAIGVDTWAGEIVLNLQKQEAYQNLELCMALPFPEFTDNYTDRKKGRYQQLLAGCAGSVVVCHAYRPDAYKKRDYYMADHSTCGIAVYDQDRSVRSSIGMVTNYAAKKLQLPITYIHPDTMQVSGVP